MNRHFLLLVLAVIAMGLTCCNSQRAETSVPSVQPDPIFAETNGIVAVEAEHFFKQTMTDKRAWYITAPNQVPDGKPDSDPAHLADASGGAYVEVLPDTRATHGDPLIQGENFTDEPGMLAVLHYRVHITTPGRFYVWVRSFSTGSEDNGVHVGLDGQWPATGQRWQTTQQQKWAWDCKQRTEAVNAGVPMQLYLDIETSGDHVITFGLREHGFEMDKFVLARDPEFRPAGQGPSVAVTSGTMPPAFPAVAATFDVANAKLVLPRQPDGKAAITVTGELKRWHKISLDLEGPFAHERDQQPNPFTDYAFQVRFTHESGSPSYLIPGYFAADGKAGNSAAESGTIWRAHFSPDKTGTWTYTVSFNSGKHVALDGGGQPLAPFDGIRGNFVIADTDKSGRDFRAHGRLQYVGKHHLQFAGTQQYFLKAGADAPETLLAYESFDNTVAGKGAKVPLKSFKSHVADWQAGDPTWRNGQGKGLIGALNYLASKGVNAFSFLTYNASGDGDNVWPFVARDDKLHYDCSKLDQWGIVFDHATKLGLYLHFKLQETEMDDERNGPSRKPASVPAALDGGKLGVERKLYCREIVARFGHALVLNWNIGEENTQTSDEVRDMVNYIHGIDPYRHHIVLHTYPEDQERVYKPLLGDQSLLTGVSLQNMWNVVHQRTLQWINASDVAGRPWVVANDEQGPANLGVPPDPGYRGYSGIAEEKKPQGLVAEGHVASKAYSLHDIRKLTLWGNLMAGGAGVEYYFGYALPENDLVAEDFRSRDQSWGYCGIALDFFRTQQIPLADMTNHDALIGNTKNDNSRFCLAKNGDLYLVYLPNGGTCDLDLSGVSGSFTLSWFNPRAGGALVPGSVTAVAGGASVALGNPPADATDDWLAVVRRSSP